MNTIHPDIIRIAECYGLEHQLGKLFEEAGELRDPVWSAYVKLITGDEIDSDTLTQLIDETADVTIMIQQIAYLTETVDAVRERMAFKVRRQLERMEKER